MKSKFGKNKNNVKEEKMNKKEENIDPEINDETSECESKDQISDEQADPETVCRELTEKLDDTKDKLIRKIAEFDNFRKRTIKEKSENFSLGVCETVERLLPILDNFDRAISAAETNDDKEALLEGIKLIKKQLDESLTEIGVCEIEAVGKEFDAEKHNAVMMEESDQPSGTVIEEFAKGYLYKKGDNERVIRHSMVKVSN